MTSFSVKNKKVHVCASPQNANKDRPLDEERFLESKKKRVSETSTPRMNSPGKSAPMTDLEHGTVYFKFGFFFFFLPFSYFASS